MHSNETSSIYIPYLLTWSIIELNLHKLKSYNILNSNSRLLKRFISLPSSNWLFAYNSNRLLAQSSSSNFTLQTQNLLIILSANCLPSQVFQGFNHSVSEFKCVFSPVALYKQAQQFLGGSYTDENLIIHFCIESSINHLSKHFWDRVYLSKQERPS